ncbi:MAG: TetR family transcriptional regulator [Blastomonas sp.]
MARPQTDPDQVREQLFHAADDLIRLRGAINVSISDIAAACDMSQSNFYRFFDSKEAFFEAMAGRWFAALDEAMESVLASGLPAREKLYEFFARRLAIKRQRYQDDPQTFAATMEIGEEHWEVVRGYVDLADHYMSEILDEAMTEGYFQGYELDHMVSLVNLMVQPFCNPTVMINMERTATEANLRIVIDTIFDGLSQANAGTDGRTEQALRAAS